MPRKPPSERQAPEALELFTDRESEQELACRLLAPHQAGSPVDDESFLTVFYGVGGVGKSTLCEQLLKSADQYKPEVITLALNLDSQEFGPNTPFGLLVDPLVSKLSQAKIKTELTHALLLIYSKVYSGVRVDGGVSELWNASVATLSEGAGAIGIPGIELLINGAQWLRDRKRQNRIRTELQELRLWPSERNGTIDQRDLQEKLANALFEDLRRWATGGRNLRIVLDGFERVQGSEPTDDCNCQKGLETFASYIADDEDSELRARVRLLIFGREKLRWDELYQDEDWKNYWNQHLLAGLAEADARRFLDKYAEWLRARDQAASAGAIQANTDRILDAADEGNECGKGRSIYPYHLDLAVDIVRRSAEAGQEIELGRTPRELQERFFRYLSESELNLLMLFSLAETFDAELFDALALGHRITGFTVGQFGITMTKGRSYVIENQTGGWRFHRLMEEALQDRWMMSDEDKERGREAVRWLLEHFESRLKGRERKDWDAECVEIWHRGVEIIVAQGAERRLLETEEWQELKRNEPWKSVFPAPLGQRIGFEERIVSCLEESPGPEHPDTLRSIGNLGNLLKHKGDYEGAEALYHRTLEGREKTLGPEHPDTLSTVGNFGILLNVKGDYEGAEVLYRRALEGYNKALGPEHPETLSAVNNLGILLRLRGDFEGAEALYRQALEGYNKALGPEHPNTLSSVANLGNLLSDKGDFEGAEALYRRALEGHNKAFGPEHPDTLGSNNNLGNLLKRKGDYEGAEVLCRRALEGYNKALGPEHPDTLSTVNNLGILLRVRGDFEGAEALYRRALEGYNKALGPEHPDTLSSVTNLGNLLSDNGDYEGAEALYRRVLEGYNKALGPEHPDTLSSIGNLGNLLKHKGDYEGAEALYRRALEGHNNALGPEHPDTLSSTNNLGILLSDKGDYEGAEVLYRRALEGKEKALGPEHPDTLSSVRNLGILLSDKGDYKGAEMLYRRALEGKEKALGPEHPSTAFSAITYGSCLRHLDRLPEAAGILREFLEFAPTEIRYNLACYECLLKHIEEAKCLLKEELSENPGRLDEALADNDLTPLHDWIRENIAN